MKRALQEKIKIVKILFPIVAKHMPTWRTFLVSHCDRNKDQNTGKATEVMESWEMRQERGVAALTNVPFFC